MQLELNWAALNDAPDKDNYKYQYINLQSPLLCSMLNVKSSHLILQAFFRFHHIVITFKSSDWNSSDCRRGQSFLAFTAVYRYH